MFWIYVLAGAAGSIYFVPAILRARDRVPTNPALDSVGFGLVTFAISGLLLERFSLGWLTVLICAFAVGGAVAAISPEITKSLSNEPEAA